MPGVAWVEILKPAIVGRLEVSPAIDSRPDRITPPYSLDRRLEWWEWSVPRHTISFLIALLRSFTRHRFRWSSSSKHDAFLKYDKQASKQRNIPSERTPKKIPLRNGPQRKYHPIVVVTNKKQT
jgi:hypothetical protein